MSTTPGEGKIELILGPMFSGKSTRLIELIRKSVYKAKKSIMIKFFADKRYSEKSEVVTHDLIKYDSINCQKLSDSFDLLTKYDVIGIDEGQFFPDIVEVSQELALLKKTVIVAALNGDFRMEPFPVISRLISKADKIKLLKAYCFNCHKDAKFSLRIVQSNETVLIGAGEAYKPACRECHVFFSKQREKGNLNIKEIETKENKENKEIKANKENKDKSTPMKIKEEKDFNSSSCETSPSPNKVDSQNIICQ
jgi:thymidine kinase